MDGYLGDFPVDISNTVYKDFTQSDWALLWIQMYGGFDGVHRKDWTLDQVVRILNGTEIVVTEARWINEDHPDGFSEYRFKLAEPTQAYHDWVAETTDGEDGPNTYLYSTGRAP